MRNYSTEKHKSLCVSVCMATFNGELFIGEQIHSILRQLGDDDELVIVDDSSSDATLDILSNIHDNRIKVFRNTKNIGATYTFEIALSHAKGSLIFLSDQDDVWVDGKLKRVKGIMHEYDVDMLVHDARISLNGDILDVSLFHRSKSGPGILKNISRNTYTGCCMAFRREILDLIMPFPFGIDLYHDAWMGVLSESMGRRIFFLNECLILYRRHETNASSFQRRPAAIGLTERLKFSIELIKRVISLKIFEPLKKDHL